jgi:hypothetical protein
MVLWELCVRQKPFVEFDNIYKYPCMEAIVAVRERYSEIFDYLRFDRELEEAVEKGLRPTVPEDCLPDYLELMRKCWSDLPAARPTFTDIIENLDKIEASRVAAG